MADGSEAFVLVSSILSDTFGKIVFNCSHTELEMKSGISSFS